MFQAREIRTFPHIQTLVWQFKLRALNLITRRVEIELDYFFLITGKLENDNSDSSKTFFMKVHPPATQHLGLYHGINGARQEGSGRGE